MARRLILASGSATRARILRSAGLAFEIDSADLDEDAARTDCRQQGRSAAAAAVRLAQLKAEAVSRRKPDALVIGADQILESGSHWFEKCESVADAKVLLRRLRGTSHRLHSGVAVAESGHTLWHHGEEATLTMRSFSETFLDRYVSLQGRNILDSVGCYRIEEGGIRLFSEIKGDYFTILGLPVVPLLSFLESCGAIDG